MNLVRYINTYRLRTYRGYTEIPRFRQRQTLGRLEHFKKVKSARGEGRSSMSTGGQTFGLEGNHAISSSWPAECLCNMHPALCAYAPRQSAVRSHDAVFCTIKKNVDFMVFVVSKLDDASSILTPKCWFVLYRRRVVFRAPV